MMQLSRLPSGTLLSEASPKVLCLKISFPFPLQQQQRLPHHVSILLEPHPLHCRWLNPNHITERSNLKAKKESVRSLPRPPL